MYCGYDSQLALLEIQVLFAIRSLPKRGSVRANKLTPFKMVTADEGPSFSSPTRTIHPRANHAAACIWSSTCVSQPHLVHAVLQPAPPFACVLSISLRHLSPFSVLSSVVLQCASAHRTQLYKSYHTCRCSLLA